MKNFGPWAKGVDHLLHGGDYNPDQWLAYPEVIQEDYRLMKEAGCDVMSVNIFGWAALEPREGEFHFEWLDSIMDGLHENGVRVILATPSAARPIWMSKKYPEVLRMDENHVRHLHGGRQNHCLTSPVYRKKVREMSRMLAERYGKHPALAAWHVSNEYEGLGCHCPLCQEAFRGWLKKKYNNDLNALNQAWWTNFWSHTYQEWDEIEAPSPIGEHEVHGLTIDWKRFVSDQNLDFYIRECEPLREITPEIPLLTNFHDFIYLDRGLNYWDFAKHMDLISWDNYPYWHTDERSNWEEAARRGFIHDMNRSFLNGKPFLLMESSPSATNWQDVAKLRRPGMQSLASIQAVAHGADTVQYFQWRKGLGSSEKFHGAVIDHYPSTQTRVFKEVQSLSKELRKMDAVLGTSVEPEVAIIYDWENFWGLDDSEGPRREKREYFDTCVRHYKAFWEKGIPVDIINMEHDLTKYKLVIAPMLYMIKKGVGEAITEYVKNGGHFVTTYWSGIANETDLCFTNGRPGPLREVMGIWSEEIDALYDSDFNIVEPEPGISTAKCMKEGMQYKAQIFCDLIHDEGAKVWMRYSTDFYKGYPALTCNTYGEGEAWYIAFRCYEEFTSDFYAMLIERYDLKRVMNTELPEGVTVQLREDEDHCFLFLQNYSGTMKQVTLPMAYEDVLQDTIAEGVIEMMPYSYRVLKCMEKKEETR